MWVPQLVRLVNRHLYLRSHLAACDQKGRKFRMLTARGHVDPHLLYLGCFWMGKGTQELCEGRLWLSEATYGACYQAPMESLGGHNVLSTSSSLPFLLRLWLLRETSLKN